MAFNWLDDPHYLQTLIREIILDIITLEDGKIVTSDELFTEIKKYHPDCPKEKMQIAIKSMSGQPYYSALLERLEITS